jgi:hypothetical protein
VPSDKPSFFSPRTTKFPLAKISITVTVTDPLKLAFWSAEPLPLLAVVDSFKLMPLNRGMAFSTRAATPAGTAVFEASRLTSVF